MKLHVLLAACIAATLVAPAAAQTTPSSPRSEAAGATPPESRASADTARQSASAGRAEVGRISETAPGPSTRSGESRFRADLAACKDREPESRASCSAEMQAARAQGLYRN